MSDKELRKILLCKLQHCTTLNNNKIKGEILHGSSTVIEIFLTFKWLASEQPHFMKFYSNFLYRHMGHMFKMSRSKFWIILNTYNLRDMPDTPNHLPILAQLRNKGILKYISWWQGHLSVENTKAQVYTKYNRSCWLQK